MPLVERLPYNPDAIDIAAIQRRALLTAWHRKRDAEVREERPFWRSWLRRI